MATYRLLFIITGLERHGAELVLLQLLTGLDRRRFEPVVVSLTGEGELSPAIRAMGIPIHKLGSSGSIASPSGLLAFARLVRSFRPDLIQGWMYHANVMAALGAWIAPGRCQFVMSIHHALANWNEEKRSLRMTILANRWLSRFAGRVVFVSRPSLDEHVKLGFEAQRASVIANGIDCTKFSPNIPVGLQFRKALGIDGNMFVIGMIARYHPIKDHATFIRTAALVASRYKDARFLLCGSDVDESNRELMDQIRAGDLGDSVILLGMREDIETVMRALDLLVLTSRSESAPMVIGEALATGVPCVTTDVGGCADLVGESGRLAPPQDAQALADAIMELIEAGAENRQQMGMAGRNRMLEQHDLSVMVGHYESLYSGLLDH